MGLEPIVELELAKKEEPNEEADEPVKPAINLTQVSPTHQARVDNIRDYIQEKIEAHGGTIRSAELLKELSFLADYRYDQRRSNRTPIMYLQSFYSSWFHIEEGEKGGFTVSNYDPLAPVRVWHSEPADTSAVISTVDETEQPLQEDALPFGEEPVLPVDEEPDLPEEENGSPSGEEPEVGGKSEAGDDSLDAVQPVPPSTPITKAGFPRNTVKSLLELGFRTVEDLLNTSENSLAHFNNLSGKKRKRLLRLQKTLREKIASALSEPALPAEEDSSESAMPVDITPESVELVEESVVIPADVEGNTGPEITIREVTPSRLPPLDTLLEKGGIPHRAATTLRKYGVKTLGDLINLSEETINQFSGIPTQRREKILQLHAEMKERYPAAPPETVATQPERKPSIKPDLSAELRARDEESNLFGYLAENNVPVEAIDRILFIVRTSANGRVVYAELRKAFGNSTANEYMQYLREYRASLG